MASEYLCDQLPSSFIFLLLISLSLFITCHEAYDLSKVTASDDEPSTTTSPFDFLKKLNGTHKGDQAKELVMLKKYLQTLGYIDTTTSNPKQISNQNNDVFDETLESAIKLYQRFFNLTVTGTLDEETLNLMLTPRCGFPDIYPGSNLTSLYSSDEAFFNSSLYNLTSHKWPSNKRLITYAFPPSTREDAFAPVEDAFDMWQSNSHFSFVHIWSHDKADMKVSFQKRDHGDGLPFDGRHGYLAHAFLPTDGRVHFDADEAWITYDRNVGDYHLKYVAMHEIGHALGLGHSEKKSAVMAPSMSFREEKEFTMDDYYAINALYPH